MPQLPSSPGFHPYDELTPTSNATSSVPKSPGFHPINEPEPPKQSWTDLGVGMGLRAAPQLAGSALGSVFGPGGMAVGGAIGGGLGEALGQIWDDDEPFNWGLIGTEAALGAVPFTKAKAAGGIWDLIKYGAKEGAAQAFVGSYPRHMARTGEVFDEKGPLGLNVPDPMQQAKEIGFGAAFGGAAAPVGHYAGKAIKNVWDSIKPPDDSWYTGQPTYDTARRQLPGEIGPSYTEGQYTDITPPSTGPGGPRVETPNTPPVTEPAGSTMPRVVTLKSDNPGIMNYFLQKGYVLVPGMRDANGNPQMVRGDVAPLYTGAGAGTGQVQEAIRPISGQDFEVPTSIVRDIDDYTNNMAEAGWNLVGKTADGAKWLFREVNRLGREDVGEFDFDAMMAGGKDVWQRLRQKLGRDPSVTEMEEEAALIRGRVAPMAGEETGRVAPFVDTSERNLPTDYLLQILNSPQVVDNPKLKTDIENLLRSRGVVPNPENAPPVKPNAPLYEGWDWNKPDSFGLKPDIPPQDKWDTPQPIDADFVDRMHSTPSDALLQIYRQGSMSPEKIDIVRAELVGRGMNPQTGEFPSPAPPAGAMDPRMAARVEAGGPREFDFSRLENPLELGQKPLPLVGELRENERLKQLADADLRRVQLQQAADRFKRPFAEPPRQGEFGDELGDTIIGEYLRGEDATPPEGRDLTEFMPPSEARAPSAGQRIEVLKQQMDEAYRRGDTREVVRIGQEINEIENPMRMGSISRGAQTPAPAFGSRGPKQSDFNVGTDHVARWRQEQIEADETQAERARALGINPFHESGIKKTGDQLAQEIYEANQLAKPSEMQVRKGGYGGGGKIIVNPKTGRPNLAMGGADPQVIRQLGQSLYTKDRPSVLIQESFQNTMDEYAISGIDEPIRVSFNYHTKNPVSGEQQNSIAFQDFGRGMNESQLYNEFSDVGKSGKRHIQGAAGGFGFAKAAPFLGGKYMRVESITMEGDEKVRYTFEGDPEQFVNQEVGVPLNREVLDDKYDMNYDKPTGMRVEVFFPKSGSFYNAGELLRAVSENSPTAKNIEFYENYNSDADTMDPKSYSAKFTRQGENGLTKYEKSSYFQRFGGLPQPPFKQLIQLPDNNVKARYEFDNMERQATKIIYLNNGVFYHSRNFGASTFGIPHIPDRIIFDINTTVPEGHTNYPFPASREGINSTVDQQLVRWYNDTIVKPAMQKYKDELKDVFDNLQPVGNNRHVILDSGEKYTPQELAKVENSQVLKRMADIMEPLLKDLEGYFTTAERKGETVKFGYRLADQGRGGINIARTDTPGRGQFAILVNPFDSFRTGFSGADQDLTPRQAARRFVHITMHEFTHNIVREEGGPFTWALSQVETRFEKRAEYEAKVLQAITDRTGNYVAEVPFLLQQHLTARGRPESTVDVLSREGTSLEAPGEGSTGATRSGRGHEPGIFGKLFSEEQGATHISDIWDATKKAARITKKATGWGQGVVPKVKKAQQQPGDYNFVEEAFRFPAAAETTLDLSPPGRQGMPNILTPQFWKALGQGFMGMPTEKMFDRLDARLKQERIHQKNFNPMTGKYDPSPAENMGLPMYTPASKPGVRAEAVASKWLEQGTFLGPATIGGVRNPLAATWKNTMGIPIRATNRFYITYLNSLMTNRAQYLMDRFEDMSYEALTTGRAPMQGLLGGFKMPDILGGANVGLKRKYDPAEAMNLNPYHNLLYAREIGDFVRTATGQAPLKTHLLPLKQAEVDLSPAGKILGAALFSPGLFSSRVRMINPNTYVMASSRIRREYMKAAFGAAMGWFALTYMAKQAADAMGLDADINLDYTNSDFGKLRIGDTRLDFGGGFLQFAALVGRAIEGGWTSSSNPEEGLHRFGEGFQAETQLSNLARFGMNKLNPAVKFAADWLGASEGKPFHVLDRTAQLFVSLFAQDLMTMSQDRPDLLPWMVPVAFGAGTQTYGKTRDYLGQGESKFIAPEDDWTITGGGLRDVIPWGNRQ